MKYLVVIFALISVVSSKNSTHSTSVKTPTPSVPIPNPSHSSARIPTSTSKVPSPTPSSTEAPHPTPSSSETPHPTPSSSETPHPTPSSTETPPPSSSKSHHASPTHSPVTPSSSVVPTTPKTTTQKPTTTPEPTVDLTVKDGNKTLIAVHGHIVLKVAVGKMHESDTLFGKGVTVTGKSLKGNTSSITAKWGKVYVLQMVFTFNKAKWFMSHLMVTVNSKKLGSIDAEASYTIDSNDQLYQAPLNKSYECGPLKKLALTGMNGNITVDFDQLKIQPYPMEGKPFKDSVKCMTSTDDNSSNSIVPIAVGCALAGLIVIVLIAYLIGRRKNNKGYQQV